MRFLKLSMVEMVLGPLSNLTRDKIRISKYEIVRKCAQKPKKMKKNEYIDIYDTEMYLTLDQSS